MDKCFPTAQDDSATTSSARSKFTYPFAVDGLFLVLMFGKYTVSAYYWRVIAPLTCRP